MNYIQVTVVGDTPYYITYELDDEFRMRILEAFRVQQFNSLLISASNNSEEVIRSIFDKFGISRLRLPYELQEYILEFIDISLDVPSTPTLERKVDEFHERIDRM